jgi:hypothetical protein
MNAPRKAFKSFVATVEMSRLCLDHLFRITEHTQALDKEIRIMKLQRLVPFALGILLLLQPAALAQSVPQAAQASNPAQTISREQRSGLASLDLPVDLTQIRDWSKDTIAQSSNGLDAAHAWSAALIGETQAKLGNLKTWSSSLATDSNDMFRDFQGFGAALSSNLKANLNNLQGWGTRLASNFGVNLGGLSQTLNQLKQEVEITGTPQELAEIEQAAKMTTTISQELDQIKGDIKTGVTAAELAEIKKAEAMITRLSQELHQIQNDVETAATPSELAEIQQAEEMTTTLEEELAEMQTAAETTATLEAELNEAQVTVETAEKAADTDIPEPIAPSPPVSNVVSETTIGQVAPDSMQLSQ